MTLIKASCHWLIDEYVDWFTKWKFLGVSSTTGSKLWLMKDGKTLPSLKEL